MKKKKFVTKKRPEDPKSSRNNSIKVGVYRNSKAGSNLVFFKAKNYIFF